MYYFQVILVYRIYNFIVLFFSSAILNIALNKSFSLIDSYYSLLTALPGDFGNIGQKPWYTEF